MQNFYREIIEEGRIDGRGTLSADSVRYHHRVLHKALDSALKQQLIQANPADAVEVPKPPEIDDEDSKENVKVLDAEQVERMLEAFFEALGCKFAETIPLAQSPLEIMMLFNWPLVRRL